ncbi:MAG: alpha/beta hydrolase [Flavobacteriales bacterium]|nr:alpha/beta hydrolase [Flavobacteriales bacterium]
MSGILCLSSLSQSNSDYCVPERFGNQYIFSENEIVVQSDIEYGLSQTYLGEWEPQLMDVYAAAPGLDSLANRPLLVILHGGGFKSGDKTDYLVTESVIAAARSGYTAVSFNYRLGYDEPSGPCSADVDDIHRAAYRALQDANAAMRFLFHNADQYGIDTSFVFVGGVSAGGTLSSLLHYTKADYFNEYYSFLPLELGPLNTSGNALDDEFSIDGLIMAWGSFPPYLDINSNNAIPVITFHGAEDSIVPIGDGTFNNCPNYPETVGPDVYIPMVETAEICYDYNRNPEGGHSVDIYGEYYIKNKTMCFIKSLMCDECTSSQQETATPLCPELGEVTDLDEILISNDPFSIAPNPTTSEMICITSEMDFPGPIDVRLVDVTGKFIASIQSAQFQNNRLYLEDLNLETGFYLVDIIASNRSIGQLRLVIE